MIIQPAKVIAETDFNYILETLPKSACPRCDAGEGCGGGILAKAFANKTYQLSINKNTQLKINELVQIGIKSSVLVRASLLLYLLPLTFMLVGALIAGRLNMNQDVYTVTGAIIGIISGIFAAKTISIHTIKNGMTSPVLIEDDQNNCWYQAD